MKNLAILALLALFAAPCGAQVLDFPGDVLPDEEANWQLPREDAQPMDDAQQFIAPPSAELDTQLAIFLSMLPKEKLFALKVALDRMFGAECPAASVEATEPKAPKPSIDIRMRDGKNVKNFKLNAEPAENNPIQIRMH